MTAPFLYTPTFAPVFNGQSVPNGLLYTYQAGTTNPKPTFADPAGIVPNSNPVQLDVTGAATVRLEPGSYHFVLTDSTGTTVYWDQDFYRAPYLTASDITSLINGTTDSENAVNAIPVDFSRRPLHVERYGINSSPGTTSMTVAFQTAINVAKKQGGVVTWGAGPYLIDAPLDLTTPPGSQNCTFAMIGEGRTKAPTNTQGTPVTPSIILKHTGVAFDTTGSLGVHFERMSIATDDTTYPQVCFLLARNSDGNSRTDRLRDCYVLGRFSKTILYNYGSEDGIYDGLQLYNISADTNTSVFDITVNNWRLITSAFTTIASGSQSTIDHKIIGGEYANLFQGSGASSYVFVWESAREIKVIGPWMDSSAKNGTSAGRALFYVNGDHGGTGPVLIQGVTGEAAVNPATFSILFDGSAVTHPNWKVIGNTFPNVTAMLGGGGASSIISQLTWLNNTNSSTGGGISFNGTIDHPYVDDTPGGFSANAVTNAWVLPTSMTLSRPTEVDIDLYDTSQASGARGWRVGNRSGHLSICRLSDVGAITKENLIVTDTGFGFNGATAVAKPTVTGSRGSNAALTSALSALASMGLIIDSSS